MLYVTLRFFKFKSDMSWFSWGDLYSFSNKKKGIFWVIVIRSCTFIVQNLLTVTQKILFFFTLDTTVNSSSI